jgi:hypothetical protein
MAKEKTGESVMIRKVLAGICAFSLMYSCSKDDVQPVVDPITEENQVTDGDLVEAVFTPTIVNQGPETRSWDDKWTGGEEIGIYMIKTTDAFDLSKALSKNKKYTVKAPAVPGTPATGEIDYDASDKMYYPLNSAIKVQFVAYCPYNSSATTTNTVAYTFTDQDTQAGKEAADFIFHKGAEPEDEYSTSDNTPVKLKFQHKFSKIRITVVPEEDSDFTIEDLTATLTNMPASATVNLAALAKDQTDAITPSTTTTTIKPYVISSVENLVEFEAIVPPHSGTGTNSFPGRQFIFDLNGRKWIHNVPNDKTFASGKEYKYELTLGTDILNMHDGLSNCYMVKPGDPVTIPITRAITIGGLDPLTANADITLTKLWDDGEHISSISELTDFADGNDREFTVTTDGTKGTGNAAIKLVKDGVIYWSWHIWVLDPDEIGTITNTNNGVVFMDHLLGATETTGQKSYGYAYQWGRKDPFPRKVTGANSYNIISEFAFPGVKVTDRNANRTGAENGVLQSVQQPMTYLQGINDDWLPYPQLYLWNTSSGMKSVYDPCPNGWRAPYVYAPWTGMSAYNEPQAGYWRSTGAQFYNESSTLQWTATSSTTNKIYGMCLFRFAESFTVTGGWKEHRKSRGGNVRCVKEL